MRGDAALPRSRWHSILTEARDGLGELSPELAVDGVQRVWAVQGDGDDLIVLVYRTAAVIGSSCWSSPAGSHQAREVGGSFGRRHPTTPPSMR